MKISTDNGSVRTIFGDKEALRLIKEAGFDGVDFTFYGDQNTAETLELPDEERRALALELKAYADELGLTFPQAHAPFLTKPGEGPESKHYQDVIKSMEFASLLGCKQIVVHSLSYPDAPVDFDVDAPNRAFMLSLLPYAEKYDIDIGVENLWHRDRKRGCCIGRHGTPKTMNAFVDSLGSPRFKVCCDLGHAAICGVEPEQFIAGMDAGRLTMLHVHDTDYVHDSHVLPYMMNQDWDAFTGALADIDYQGYMNLEVLIFYEMFPKELVPAALKMAAEVARKLADEVEQKKNR